MKVAGPDYIWSDAERHHPKRLNAHTDHPADSRYPRFVEPVAPVLSLTEACHWPRLMSRFHKGQRQWSA